MAQVGRCARMPLPLQVRPARRKWGTAPPIHGSPASRRTAEAAQGASPSRYSWRTPATARARPRRLPGNSSPLREILDSSSEEAHVTARLWHLGRDLHSRLKDFFDDPLAAD